MAKYKKKPVIIEAILWKGYNYDEVENFIIGTKYRFLQLETTNVSSYNYNTLNVVVIKTLEGEMMAFPDDYIIKGVNGEFYPCKPDIFEKTYEKVEE